ncbi:MAG: GNAT family N-acetyltransferase [Desulfarculus sp.]|jgi:RimJ/RimL family protein N-acetyltransferase|nr:MAG: GNAT family N-acetyltransferase [Desulfarculus sp.]
MAQPPRVSCQDKTGQAFAAAACGPELCQALWEMYDRFEPKGWAQGLPPHDPHTRHAWVEAVLAKGHNFVLYREEEVIGHAALLPDTRRRDAELIVFLLPAFQNRGLGSALTQLAMDKAAELGLCKLFLEVAARNTPAIRLYRKFRFEFCDQDWESERVMVCTLVD